MKHKMKEVPLKAPDEKIMDLSVAPWGYTQLQKYEVFLTGMARMMSEQDSTFKECEWAVAQTSNSILSPVLSPVDKCC